MMRNQRLFERLDRSAPHSKCCASSVAAHLGKMLSIRAGSVQTLPDYGLPDLNDMNQSLHETLSRSRLLIERFIRAYEPRLQNVLVRALPRRCWPALRSALHWTPEQRKVTVAQLREAMAGVRRCWFV